ncbi:PAS domain-containing methyl-accepting chemotaxis protein [Bradyrhizobium sp. Tv2a-2]|uniref:methyl-accepting chemotaxis protein n=1 Tax=Bradyrhizobium sp. Tv2a-2 TaxID=113395 RepID=UPI0004266EDF|nr:PAS domain-containing methyl-accepting chemotaxis protein [Bradyrhizobium sp. Tv2a-2]
MFGWNRNAEFSRATAMASAIDKSQGVIEFEIDGTISTANDNFLKAMGYTIEDIRGRHHSIFVPPNERDTVSYRDFWAKLNRGERQAALYRRIGKGGRIVWIQASYNPILNCHGRPIKVVKFATDISALKFKAMEDAGKVAAIERAQAVIEFNLDGTIITANENFLKMMGYALDELKGKHHRMFVDPSFRESADYRKAWEQLNRGEFLSGEYKRIGKNGKEVWILASYNPVRHETGRPFKVVKLASDITEQKLVSADTTGQIDAIKKSQAVIEFRMDGTIGWANHNFLKAMGYGLVDVQGKHHSMFVPAEDRASLAYANFWKNLNRGEYQSGEFKRVAKGGREIWIEASYNPILDFNGKAFKVVKYATDVTEKAMARMKAEEAKGLIESVAAGSEEMTASIREIAETMVKSRETANTAVMKVEAADAQAQRLAAATEAMGGIVELIGNITGQINLLALNATIESARAGEAGRGFAVVASEVKSLASQAKHATDKIATEIDALNGVSSEVVNALSAIRTAITHVHEYVASTAAAVDEQNAVTADMSTNMQRAAAALA